MYRVLVERFMIAVYAPESFRETWDKFKDYATKKGSSAAKELRAFIAEEVERSDIASPQRKITMYEDLSPDEKEVRILAIVQYFEKKATFDPYFATRDRILDLIQDLAKGNKRVVLCNEIIASLKKRGVSVS